MENRKIVYTDAGHVRRQQLIQDLERQIDTAVIARKFVPGIDIVEVTGSDIDELARSMDVVFRDRYRQSIRSRLLILNLYLVLGALTVLAGLFYDWLRALAYQPTRLLLIGTGVFMISAALGFRFYLTNARTRDLKRRREYLQKDR